MLTFDFTDFERAAQRMQGAADQIPFAMAQSLNDGAELARKHLAEDVWPQHMRVRNTRFIGAALTTRGHRATKRKLLVAIVDKLGRGSLLEHSRGGTKRAKGSNLAIPSTLLKGKRTGRGVPKGMRPGALPTSGPKAAFRRGDEIYQRTGTGKSAGLTLLYTLRPSAPIRAEVPFEAEFGRVMTREVWRAFGPRFQAAMAGRRK